MNEWLHELVNKWMNKQDASDTPLSVTDLTLAEESLLSTAFPYLWGSGDRRLPDCNSQQVVSLAWDRISVTKGAIMQKRWGQGFYSWVGLDSRDWVLRGGGKGKIGLPDLANKNTRSWLHSNSRKTTNSLRARKIMNPQSWKINQIHQLLMWCKMMCMILCWVLWKEKNT